MRRISTFLCAVAVACALSASLPAAAFCTTPVTRDVALSRGSVWLNWVQRVDPRTHKKTYGVPYSQSRWAAENGSPIATATIVAQTLGYRTDCSGFASMCWDLQYSNGVPFSADTQTFALNRSPSIFKLREITKAEIEPGDLVLKAVLWGAPSGHAIIFAGWADPAQKTFWAMEQTTSSTHDGTILRVRTWGERYYKAFRNVYFEDAWSDKQTTFARPDIYQTAVQASQVAFPAPSTKPVPALVIASGASVADQLSGASLAGVVGGPLLLSAKGSVPASTLAEVQRLKPKRIYVLGTTVKINAAARQVLSSVCTDVVRVNAANDYDVAAAVARTSVPLSRAAGKYVDTAYVVGSGSLADALMVAPLSAKNGRPILYVTSNGVPASTCNALRALGIRKVVVVGSGKAVSSKAVAALKKRARVRVSRLYIRNVVKQSIATASEGMKLGLGWNGVGLASYTSFRDAAASAANQAQAGSFFLLTATGALDGNVAAQFAAHKAELGKVRVFGSTAAVSAKARGSLASILRAP